MKKGLRITLIAAAFCLLGLVCIVIHRMNERRVGQLTCAGVKVEFTDDFNFVTAKDVEGYLNKGYGSYIGQRLDSVDLRKVESVLDNKSAILKAEAYTTPDGYLNVRIRQREPVVRFQKDNNGYYADEKGFLFPLQRNYTSMVPIIDGALPLNVERGYKGEPRTDMEKQDQEREKMACRCDRLGELHAGFGNMGGKHQPDHGQRRQRSGHDSEAGKGTVHLRASG